MTAIAGAGSLDKLLYLSINRGDVWILGAALLYAVYTPLRQRRPAVHPLSFLVTVISLGSLMMLPLYLLGAGQGVVVRGGWTSCAAIAYTAVLPSFVAYLFSIAAWN